MKFIITDNAEPESTYIKQGEVSEKEFARLLMNELKAYVDTMDEEFTININGVWFIVEK